MNWSYPISFVLLKKSLPRRRRPFSICTIASPLPDRVSSSPGHVIDPVEPCAAQSRVTVVVSPRVSIAYNRCRPLHTAQSRNEALDPSSVRRGVAAWMLAFELGVQEDDTERMEGARDDELPDPAESARFSTLRRARRKVDASSDLKPERVEAKLCLRLRESSSSTTSPAFPPTAGTPSRTPAGGGRSEESVCSGCAFGASVTSSDCSSRAGLSVCAGWELVDCDNADVSFALRPEKLRAMAGAVRRGRAGVAAAKPTTSLRSLVPTHDIDGGGKKKKRKPECVR